MPEIDWLKMFGFTVSPWELMLRGTLVYLFLFCLFRFVMRRDVGELGIADLLVLVIVADASQNAMSSDYASITDGVILVSTIGGWNYLFNFLGFHYPRFRKFTDPPPLLLVKQGQKMHRNMRREYITDDELDAMLRVAGIERLEEVKRAYMEPDGQLSVIRADSDSKEDTKPPKRRAP